MSEVRSRVQVISLLRSKLRKLHSKIGGSKSGEICGLDCFGLFAKTEAKAVFAAFHGCLMEFSRIFRGRAWTVLRDRDRLLFYGDLAKAVE